MNVKDRVSEYCKRKNIAISRFEKEAGLSNGYFNQVKKRPSLDKLESIGKAFPDLNKDWLLTGEGEMLNAPLQSGHDNNQQNAHGTGITQTLTPSANEAALIENTAALINEVVEMRKLIAEQTRNNQDQFNKFMELINNLTHK